MTKPAINRLLYKPPNFKGFKVIGLPEENNVVVISYEESETIRLSDFELLNQVEAARIMEVSRPIYTRIYGSARRKVAEALVMGKTLLFQGGNIYFDSDWYSCRSCGSFFNQLDKVEDTKICTMCGSSEIEPYNEKATHSKTKHICICPKCGIEKVKSLGIPCRNEICPQCNGPMMRKGTAHYNRLINKMKKQSL